MIDPQMGKVKFSQKLNLGVKNQVLVNVISGYDECVK